jgi:cell fate regulator YaaT (PSP1 superfamily)
MNTGNPIYRGCPTSKLSGTCAKLEVHDWLGDVPNTANTEEIVEIRFKNTRKDYFKNVNSLPLEVGELVAVEGNPGHDIGMVSLTGDLVLKQMRRHKVSMVNGELRKVYRKAKPVDIEKWEAAMKMEHETMIKTRQIASDLKLNMKIGDVEFQGDGTKAIFYYIADDRVDFRQLIKNLAEAFHIRIEMKQIGARQEAGRIGGIGPCGRELCCSAWMSGFSSVTTGAARYQEISLNPQKLAGQCSKLKCCLNYELDSYIDEQRYFPPKYKLETEEGEFNYVKTDVFKRTYWYSRSSSGPAGMVGIPVEKVKLVQQMNRRGQKPEKIAAIIEADVVKPAKEQGYGNVVGQDSLTRFDKPKDANRRNIKRRRPSGGNPNQQVEIKNDNHQENQQIASPETNQHQNREPRAEQNRDRQAQHSRNPRNQQHRNQPPRNQQPREDRPNDRPRDNRPREERPRDEQPREPRPNNHQPQNGEGNQPRNHSRGGNNKKRRFNNSQNRQNSTNNEG